MGFLSRKPLSVTNTAPNLTDQELVDILRIETGAGEVVSSETARKVATAYRCGNIISDDVAKMPLQMIRRAGGRIEQVTPDPFTVNVPYLLEISPNMWGWTPFIFKKAVVQWLLYWGNALIWRPLVWPPQLLILPADRTEAMLDQAGNLWYRHRFSNGEQKDIPSVEVLHLMINPDKTGFWGRSILQYAKDTIGRQLAAMKTQGKFFTQGLNPAGYITYAGQLDREGREKVREAYGEAIGGTENAYRLAVFDSKVTKFEPITMKPNDAQFLESIQANDHDIATFFGLPEYKLNMGKQAYSSNEQNNIDYLTTTLDPILVQWEQGARIKWVPVADQADIVFRFIRESLLRTDAKTRAELNEVKIRSGQMTPNEAREKDDVGPYPEGDRFYMTSNYAAISADGSGGMNGQEQ
jgi:HK97 family phage portal protein